MRIAGLIEAAVVLPPDAPHAGYMVSPISGFTALTGKAERFGREHRDDRPRAGAEVLRADLHHDAAVGGDVAVRAAAAAAAAPLVGRHAEAVLDRTGRRIAGHVALLPAKRLRALREVVAPCRVRRGRRQVLDAELDRIHADAIGELVHQDFGEEAPLRMSRRAHRALLSGVDVDVGVHAAAIRELIDVRQREIGRRACAARAPALAIERRELAVGRHAGSNLRERRWTVARVEMFFLAIEKQLHGHRRLLAPAGRR